MIVRGQIWQNNLVTLQIKKTIFRQLFQRTLTIRGSINVHLTSCLTGLEFSKQVKPMLIQHKLNKQNKQEVSCTVILPLFISKLRKRQYQSPQRSEPFSVTRLVDISKVLASKFLTKTAQLFGPFEKTSLFSKTFWQLLAKIGPPFAPTSGHTGTVPVKNAKFEAALIVFCKQFQYIYLALFQSNKTIVSIEHQVPL